MDLFDLAMSDTVKKYPAMDIQPYKDMIAGMIMDVPGLGQERYKNFEELYLYCYRVAGTVGLMTLPILGTAEGCSQEDATPSAIALGIGLQLTNILRDVGEDLERGRIYLPLDEIASFGLTEQDLFKCEVARCSSSSMLLACTYMHKIPIPYQFTNMHIRIPLFAHMHACPYIKHTS